VIELDNRSELLLGFSGSIFLSKAVAVPQKMQNFEPSLILLLQLWQYIFYLLSNIHIQ